MKHLKTYNESPYRLPRKCSLDECERKLQIHGAEVFSNQEIDFLIKFKISHPTEDFMFMRSDNCSTISHEKSVKIRISNRSTYFIYVNKMGDSWFYITLNDSRCAVSKYFICDEFEEVKGFLNNYFKVK